ncbi:MAG: Rossmann-like domain-containing protein [Candidatus Rifleibacteriota bacterium]
MNLEQSLINFGKSIAENQTIKDLRLGLGYSCVELSDGKMGLAWTPDKRQSGSCTHLDKAGNILGLSAIEALEWLKGENLLERAVALAVFNALNSKIERNFEDAEAISQLNIKSSDHVVMVGYFAPVIPAIKKTGCLLEVVELDQEKPDVITPLMGFNALENCDIAIITSTSIINNTVNSLLNALKNNRAAVMLGPSTPMCPEAFAGSRITQLSGSFVKDKDAVKTVVSQGGGTRLLKKHIKFSTVKRDLE